MFDIGFWEMTVIGIVTLIVVGPERLPKVAKTVGSFIGKAQRYVQNVKGDLKREFDADDLMRMMEEQKQTIETLKNNIQDNVNTFSVESNKVTEGIDSGDKADIEEIDLKPAKTETPTK